MIYTLTLNPSIDYTVEIDGFESGHTNRSTNEYISFGGKGINVSAVLKNLGVKSTALGFIGGSTGDMFEKDIKDYGIDTDFIKIENGNTRINVKIKGNEESEINATGPTVKKEEIENLTNKLLAIKKGDYLVMAGSLPKGISTDFYKDVMHALKDKGIKIILDTYGEQLKNALPECPFLIKPNIDELEQICGKKLNDMEEIKNYAKELQSCGAKNVMVSFGAKGAALFDENSETHFVKAHKGKLISAVGAGDSMIAGFIYGKINNMPYGEILKYANAAGGATAFSKGLADKAKIDELLKQTL